ncbi:hypothetical protein GCM10023333_09840 [Ferrimonas pelagia]|uniref:Uncharacterized protein n=1 Tax=Ferrimonas pelagia TaxID=1177826 RepID=A0ABP9EI73_9GAMM
MARLDELTARFDAAIGANSAGTVAARLAIELNLAAGQQQLNMASIPLRMLAKSSIESHEGLYPLVNGCELKFAFMRFTGHFTRSQGSNALGRCPKLG